LLLKRLISFLLILSIFCSLIGYYLIFKIEQFQVKERVEREILKNIPEEELTIIIIPQDKMDQIKWTEENKEFKYNGEMYDLVKSIKRGDTIHYYCYNDVQETKLITILDKLVKEQSDNSKTKTLQKQTHINYFFQRSTSLLNSQISTITFNDIVIHYKSIKRDIIPPPPKEI
jgi:hypothetical protein